jgi:N6-adenosine-specific RNA methylase IME4
MFSKGSVMCFSFIDSTKQIIKIRYHFCYAFQNIKAFQFSALWEDRMRTSVVSNSLLRYLLESMCCIFLWQLIYKNTKIEINCWQNWCFRLKVGGFEVQRSVLWDFKFQIKFWCFKKIWYVSKFYDIFKKW